MEKFRLFLWLTILLLFFMQSCRPAPNHFQPLAVRPNPILLNQETETGQADTQNRHTASPRKSVDPWPATPPQIGKLILKQEYWNYMKEAAEKYRISPYLIQAVCAIESRYNPQATSGRGQCLGLMQLHRLTAKKYGVNPHNPRENIMGGAAVLARLLEKYNGNLLQVLRVYNAESTPAYEREVIKAYQQAMRNAATMPRTANRRHEPALKLESTVSSSPAQGWVSCTTR